MLFWCLRLLFSLFGAFVFCCVWLGWLLGCFGAALDCWLFLICLLVNSVGMICLNILVLGVCFLLCCWISSSWVVLLFFIVVIYVCGFWSLVCVVLIAVCFGLYLITGFVV